MQGLSVVRASVLGSEIQARVPDRVQATWTFSPVVLCLPEYSSEWSFQDQH